MNHLAWSYAHLLREKLNEFEFLNLQELLDNSPSDLSEAVSELAAEMRPDLFVSGDALKENQK